MRESGESIERLLVANHKQEAWKRISIWYRQVLGGKDPPLRNHLDRIAMEREDLYRCRHPEGLRVPIMVTPSEVEDGFPEESDITQVLRGLKGGRAGGPSGMQAEYVKGWLREASREKNPVRRRWWLLVRLIKRTSEDGLVPEEVAWVTMVFLLKGGGIGG